MTGKENIAIDIIVVRGLPLHNLLLQMHTSLFPLSDLHSSLATVSEHFLDISEKRR